MLLDFFILLIGIYAFQKKQIFISQKWQIVGNQAKYLGILLLITGLLGMNGEALGILLKSEAIKNIVNDIYSICFLVSIVLITYFFVKNRFKKS